MLIADPEIILLDEPAGGVNPTLIGTISERIRELNRQGTTFLIVEHNMEFVMGLCEQVTVLDYGNAVVSGPPPAAPVGATAAGSPAEQTTRSAS